ncbi:MAG: hypothetical protein ACM3X3_09995 [Betaproteobacteria bacterium]
MEHDGRRYRLRLTLQQGRGGVF